jgi:succinate dehydrogenase/fumarate reductase cytochrome b subunit
MRELTMFGAMFVYVMLRATQQRNVAFDNYTWVVPTSYCMAVVDVFIIAFVAHTGWTIPIVLANGTGGALGALCAMQFHKRCVKKK